jgi:hypothetical protein
MNTFSNKKKMQVIGKLNAKKIQCLLGILHSAELCTIEFVTDSYHEQQSNIEEVLQFALDIKWVTRHGDQLGLTNEGKTACRTTNDEGGIRWLLGDSVVSEKSPYRGLVLEFLSKFEVNVSNIAYKPSITERLYESPLRNLLLDLRFISYEKGNDVYVLEDVGVELLVLARNVNRSIACKDMQLIERQKEEMGLRAERIVLEYEKKRVDLQYANMIDHISANNPYACYDIKSFTFNGDKVTPRYIEVKAVSIESYQFYWSASELETARLLKDKYYLYLLPVVGEQKYDLAQMLILPNPFLTVYTDSKTWLIEENVLLCRRK